MSAAAAGSLAAAALFAVWWRAGAGAVWFSLLLTALTLFYHMAMRLLVGWLFQRRTRPFDPENTWFRVRGWEQKLFRLLRVKRWKRLLPTALPEQFSLQGNAPGEVVQAMCRAELVHETSAALGFLSVLFARWSGDPSDVWIFLGTSALAGLFDLLFVAAQRFNRPRMLALQKKKGAKRS